MEFLIAAIAIGVMVAILLRVYAWMASSAKDIGSSSPVVSNFQKGLLLEDYKKPEDPD